MPTLEAAFDPTDTGPTEVPVPVGRFASAEAAAERGLVVLALGHPYWLVPASDHYVLEVEAAAVDTVGEQLARYERESLHWPPVQPPPGPVPARATRLLPLLWILSLLGCHWAQFQWPAWLQAGALEPRAVFQNAEWWRPFTALFLHADIGHLVSNAIAGGFVFTAVLSTFGGSAGWLLVAASAFAANVVSAALPHAGDYSAIGASTAIFAGLGLLTGRAVARVNATLHLHPWRRVLVPLSAGIVLFALWGGGGPRVDFGGHVCGFATGLLGGLLFGRLTRDAPDASGQTQANSIRSNG